MRKPRYLIVEDRKGYVRDSHSNGIINTDFNALSEHRRRKALINKKNRQIERQESEIQTLKEEFSELKNLVNKLIEKES